jgi:DNA-binding MarR family transcriptional regulator
MSSAEPAPDQVDAIIAAWRTELPEVAGLPMELSKRITRLAMLVDAVTAAELGQLELTKAEFEVLARLRSAGPPYRRKPNDLTKALFLSSGGTTNVLHRLTVMKLVTREADSADRRSSWVRLTDEGVRTAEAALIAVNKAQTALFDRIPEDTAHTLTALLKDVSHTLNLLTVPYQP